MIDITYEAVLNIVNSCIYTRLENNGELERFTAIDEEQIEEDIAELGVDSITFVHIIIALEETFNCELPDSKLLLSEMNTIVKITEIIQCTFLREGSINEKA